jgi:predicted double-glycine peptidase
MLFPVEVIKRLFQNTHMGCGASSQARIVNSKGQRTAAEILYLISLL